MRVAVIDLGTNSTRLLVAGVENGQVTELERCNTVTRLGRGVDLSRQLCSDAIEDVCAVVGDYLAVLREMGAERVSALATSAVRDASNGGAFIAELRERFALDAQTLSGEEEARLTYLGAMASRDVADGELAKKTLVFDIGGGSTELVCGRGAEVEFNTSLQVGTVRHTERHLLTDPPSAAALDQLATDVRGQIEKATSESPAAVAGTPTSLAAIDLELDPYDPEQVHGHRMSLQSIQRMFSRLAAMPLAERLKIPGLHPGRAPTIVAGVVILVETMRAFGLSEIEASEQDILWGSALATAVAPV